MDLISADFQQYAETHTTVESDLLQKIRRETHLHVLRPRMLSGHLQGAVLSFFCRMINPMHVLEIGTYTGYATIAMAEGLSPKGKIWTIDINEELEPRVRDYFNSFSNPEKIEFIVGDAHKIIPKLNKPWDLVFIDADKQGYANYYDMVLEDTVSGGFIVADNVVWDGKVFDPEKKDQDTEAIRSFNQMVQEDNRVENVLFPIRDGLMVVRKK